MTNVTVGLALAQAEEGAEVAIAAASPDGEPLYGAIEEVARYLMEWSPRRRLTVGRMQLRLPPRSLRERLSAFSPDVVHMHGEFNPDNYWPLRLLDVPVVLSPQGAFNPVVLDKSHARVKRAYVSVARRMLYDRVATFHANSPLEASHVSLVAPAKSVYVVPQGGGWQLGKALDGRLGPTARQGEGPVRLLYVGRLDVYTKGLDILLEAFARAEDEAPGCATLTLVGPDWQGGLAQLQEQAERLGIRSLLEFAGSQSPEGVASRYATADALAHVSRHEGFSLSVTEGLIAGKPVVMTTETGQASYREVSAAPHVLLVHPKVDEVAAALAHLVAHIDGYAARAAIEQPRLVEFFDWRRIGREHLAQYDLLRR